MRRRVAGQVFVLASFLDDRYIDKRLYLRFGLLSIRIAEDECRSGFEAFVQPNGWQRSLGFNWNPLFFSLPFAPPLSEPTATNNSHQTILASPISRGQFNLNSLFCWCREGGSNPHDRKGRRILSPLRLPVPPSRRGGGQLQVSHMAYATCHSGYWALDGCSRTPRGAEEVCLSTSCVRTVWLFGAASLSTSLARRRDKRDPCDNKDNRDDSCLLRSRT